MRTKPLLVIHLSLMAGVLVYGFLFPQRVADFFARPDLYLHAKFIHILCVTMFFSNTVIGTIWETRSLLTKDTEIIRYAYRTVTWFDAVITAPLILLAAVSGVMLATILGGVWANGWLSIAFSLFLLSGLLWQVADIPTQYRVNRLSKDVPPRATQLPRALMATLWLRLGINLVSIVPLLFIFYLMIHKPELPSVASWFADSPVAELLTRR